MTPTDPTPPGAAAAVAHAAESFLDKMRRHSDLPGLGLTASRVAQLTASDTRRGDLVNLVLTDAGLTQRTLRLANSVLYRRDTEPITTVSRALLMVGFDQVRMLALSQALLEQFENRNQSDALRAELGEAVYASMLAKRHFFRHPLLAEEGAVCAMLRGVGRMMVASHAFDVYSAVRQRAAAEKRSENRVMADTTGFGYDAIAHQLMVDWGMPDRIVQGCESIPQAVPQPKTPDDRLRVGTEFCTQLAAAGRAVQGAEREAALGRVVERFGEALGVDRQSVDELMVDAYGMARSMLNVLGLGSTVDGPALAPGTDTAAGSPDRRPGGAAVPPTGSGSDIPEQDELADGPGDGGAESPLKAGNDAQAKAILLAGIAEMNAALASPHELADVLRIALESVYRAFSCKRALLFLHDQAGHGFRAVLWIGDFDAERARQFKLTTQGQTHLFAASLAKNADVYIRDARDPKIASSLPEEWRRQCADAGNFFLLPMVLKDRPLGLFYADRTGSTGATVDADELTLLRALKGQALLALRLGTH